MTTEKFITLNSNSIRTLITGQGQKALVFVHGNSSSADSWNHQSEDIELREKYQLISFDLPGHGKSARSNNYRMKDMAIQIANFIEQLQLDEYILVGLSYGTCLIAEAAPYIKNCKGFLLASPNITNNEHPPASWLVPFAEAAAIASASVDDETLTRFATRMVAESTSPLVNEYKKTYRETDGAFREAIGKAIMESDWSDEFVNLLNTGLATCIAFGEHEKMIRTNYLNTYPKKWRDEIFKIPDAAHLINAEQPFSFNRLLLEFAGDVFK
ncbi:MAG TPA: alpha/beta hydrolase [Puia sp.]|nr:alpha/beta hydrolase [Puia sp.]